MWRLRLDVSEGSRLEVVVAKSSQRKKDWRRQGLTFGNGGVCDHHSRSEMRPSWGQRPRWREVALQE